MRLVRPIRTAAVVIATFLSLGAGIAPAHAQAKDPLGSLLSPALEDPVVAVLPAMPMPYRPYTGSICQSGQPQCIEDVISTMGTRLAPLAETCDHNAIFSLAYLRVTQNVKAATDAGYFTDRRWLTRIDAVFAHKYFETLDTWTAGHTSAVAPAWRIALQASDDKTMSGLGDFMLGMNAHINNDFPYVLAQVGLTGPDGKTHKPDHNAYNDRLDSLYHPVFDEEAARFDPEFNKIDIGPVDDLAVSSIMRGWREMVWRHAEALVATRNAPVLHRLVEKEIAQYAAAQAQLVKAIPIFLASSTPQRESFCATHHG